MPLSRLENFLKNVEGNILYVNPTDLDATDSIDNQGNSLTRPFKTIQRALLEAARFSYQIGLNNDKFNRTTILLYPGTHEIDNRPGYNVVQSGANAIYRDRNGVEVSLNQLSSGSNYNIDDSANELFKYNSVEGGVIVPRGVSIVGLDLRKTNIRPKFVPDPTDDAILRSAIFRITGGCYFWQFTIFDGDSKGSVYKDYSNDRYTPSFSHHKLTVFEYADGVNGVGIGTSTTTSDLSMYYHKIQKAYGDSSGRAIVDFPTNKDMQAKLPEYEIVGPVSALDVGITSIRAGAGSKTNTSTTITVDCDTPHNLVVDSEFRVSGVNTYPNIYNGNFVVTGVSSERIFTYRSSSPPTDGLPDLDGDEKVVADTDTVSGASPYIFNCSLRSVYGMCGMHADGSKATGFKSMVVAQYTGVGLQKDNNAFLFYNETNGQYDTNATVADSEKPLYLNSKAVYRPSYENYHVKCSNKSVIQIVSVFAIGYANHFLAESGGDQSITNSNSNFGAKSLIANGFQDEAFNRDNRGYVTHIVPPRRLSKAEKSVEWLTLNVGLTTNPVGVGTTQKIFIDEFTDPDVPPPVVIEGYRLGAKSAFSQDKLCTDPDLLNISIAGVGTFSAPIRMLNKDGTSGPSRTKEYNVGFVGAANSITTSVLTLQENHELYAGESIRVISDDGSLPDGIESNTIYYAVTNDSTNETLNPDQIKLARTENEAILGGSGNFITINNDKGGRLRINSRVTDKQPGDYGHPVQYDTTNSNWYINSDIDPVTNRIYDALVTNGPAIGARTNKSFFTRKEDNRSINDKIYKLRYVLPKESQDARPPIPGFVIQDSSTVGVTTASDFTDNIPNATIQRNIRILKGLDRDSNSGVTTFVTEKPHNFEVGDTVNFLNIKSSGNTVGAANSGYNISRVVTGISSSKGFEVNFSNDPGSFINNISTRDDGLPTVSRKSSKETFTVYRVETLKAHEYNKQDGVYHLICIDSSIKPTVNEFGSYGYNQQIENLYPQFDADNFVMDPSQASSFAVNTPQGKVVTNDLRYSITKEFTNRYIRSNGIGIGITFAEGSTQGITTIYTDREHNLNSIISVGLGSTGLNYGAGVSTTLYNASLTYSGIETGRGATANIDIDANGGITAITIVDGGSAYGVGHTLNITGVETSASHVQGWVTVNKISNNIGDAIEIVGVGTSLARYVSGYNGIHTITAIRPQAIEYNNGFWPGYYDVNTVGLATGFMMYAGPVPDITNVVYDSSVGVVTVTTAGAHGLNVNNPFKIVGVAQTIFNTENIVRERVSTTKFNFKFNEDYDAATYTSGGSVLPVNYAARGGVTEAGSERLAQRHVPFRTGIQTAMSGSSLNATSTTLTLGDSSGFQKGDYVQIDGEIIRISSDFASNAATVLRGQLGSRSAAHDASSLVKKLRILATEKRRHSILRASGHTFEYLGYGPGNYSSGLPQKQDRILSREEQFLSQSQTPNGGAVVYTGMNDAGDFYIGNKVINAQDGTEATFNIPVPTVTGADQDGSGTGTRLDAIFDSVTVREGITVDGNNNSTTRFNGPVVTNEKLTNTSSDGIETVQISINGGLTENRTITYSPSKPTTSGTTGDIVFNSNPSFGQYIGWVYTQEAWKRFGLISTEVDETQLSLNTVGVGSTSASRIGAADGLDVRGTIIADAFVCAGVCTFSGNTTFASITFDEIAVSGVGTFSNRLDVTGNSNFVGVTTLRNVESLNVTGISTFGGNIGVTGTVTATSFSGPLTGNVTGDVNGNVFGNLEGNADTATSATSADTATNANNINVDEKNDNVNYQVLFSATNGAGYQRPYIDTNNGHLTYNPSTHVLVAGTFDGNLQGNVTGNVTGNVVGDLEGTADNATNATNVNLRARNTTDATHYITFGTATTGNQRINTDSGLTYNPSTGELTTTFVDGNLEGTADNATNVRVDHDTGNAWHRPCFVDDGSATNSNLRIKTDNATTIGINPSTNRIRATVFDGDLEGTADAATNATNVNLRARNTTNATHYPTFGTATTGNQRINTDSGLTYNPSTGVLTCAEHSANSDERLKKNIETITDALNKVTNLRGVEFDLKENDRHQIGVIAQEVEKVIPSVVSEREDNGTKTVAYGNMVGLLIEAIKEQQVQIQELKAKVDDLSK